MSYLLSFQMPGLPVMTNKASGKDHWRYRHAESRKWKSYVMAFVVGKRPAEPLQRAKLTLIRFSSVAPDSDGLVSGFKHIIDGLVLAKVLVNDKFENIGMPTYEWKPVKRGQGFVSVKVESWE